MKVNLPSYPDYSPAKINSAYTYGGVDETVKTIKSTLIFQLMLT